MLTGSWPSQIEGSKALRRRIAREVLVRELAAALQQAAERQARAIEAYTREAA